MSIISAAEPYEGVFCSPDEQEQLTGLLDFLSGVHVLTVDDEVARAFGKLRSALRPERGATGLTLGFAL